MKRATLIVMLAIMLFPVIIYALSGTVPEPKILLRFRDRIRNVVAVESATEPSPRLYVSTFGISSVGTQEDEIPVFEVPQIYRFRLYNSEMDDDSYDRCQLLMDDDFIQDNTAVDYLICYDEDDLESLLSWYPNDQWFGGLRYGSGCGFWSSPVLYKYNDEINYLFAINKSGLLLVIDADYGSSFQQAVYAAIDLRDLERSHVGEHSYAFEYASTPVAIGDYLYVAGLQSFFKIDISNPSTIESSVAMLNVAGLANPNKMDTEYFFSAVTWDYNTAGDIILSATTRSHNSNFGHTIMVDENLNQFFANSDIPGGYGISPCYDDSGYTYLSRSSMYRTPRDLRDSEYEGCVHSQIDQQDLSLTYGDILSDFTGNLIFQTLNGSGIQITDMDRSYSFMDDNPIHEISYDDYGYLSSYGNTLLQFDANNHGLVFEDPEHKRSLVVSICSTNRSEHHEVGHQGEFFPLFYDDQTIYDEYGNIYGDWGMQIGMLKLDRSGNGENEFRTCGSGLNKDTSYGGLAAYKTNENHINILYGTERGYVRCLPWHLPSEYVGYPFRLEPDEPVISNTSRSKFQRDVTNNCSYPWVENHQVNISDVPQDYTIDAVFANGYKRVPEGRNEDNVVFERLQAHPNYTFGFRYTDDQGQTFVRELHHVSIPEQSPLNITFDVDLVVLPGEEITINTANMSYNSITIHNNGKLCIETDPVFTNELILYDNSLLEITDGSVLHANSCNCISDSETPVEAVIDLHGGGHLYVFNEMSFGDDEHPLSARCKITGSDNDDMTVSDLSMRVGDVLVIDGPSAQGSTEATLVVEKANQIAGNIQITGTMRVLSKLEIGDYMINGYVWVMDEGHLLMCPGENQTSTADLAIHRGGTALEVASGGDLTFRGGGTLDAENSTSTIHVLGNLNLEQGVELDVENGLIAMGEGSNIFMSHGVLHMTLNSTLLLSHQGVTITGSKTKDVENNLPADQIVIDGGGDIISDHYMHPDNIYNVTIASSDERWKGIMFDPPTQYMKLLIDWDVSGVEMMRFTGNQDERCGIILIECHIHDCTSGVRAQGINELLINASSFENCMCGVFAYRVKDVKIYVGNNGEDPDNAYMDNNQYAVIIIDADVGDVINNHPSPETIYNYSFDNNTVAAITYMNSLVNIGGRYDDDYAIYIDEGGCAFTNNNIGIDGSISSPHFKSVIAYCSFTDGTSDAIYLSDQNVRIGHNTISGNGRNGLWGYRGAVSDISNNSIEDNGGAEIVGYLGFMTAMDRGDNYIADENPIDGIQTDNLNLWDANQMDGFILVYPGLLSPGDEALVRGNRFNNEELHRPYRFYPSVHIYNFGTIVPTGASELFANGISDYESGRYESADISFTILVMQYPESKEAISALIYLLYIESKTDENYAELRLRLNAMVTEDYPDLYKEKEYVVTQSYLYEEKYLDVIERLEETIASPDTKMDSVVALATQGYCYVQLAESGTRALPPKCTVRTKTYEEYLEYMRNLRSTLNGEVETSQAPAYTFSLDANYPNPFNPTTTISYSIPKDGKVELKVYNIKGQLVKTLVKDHLEAGTHKAVWDGDNDTGKRVSSGVYLYRLESSGKTKVRKMLLLK